MGSTFYPNYIAEWKQWFRFNNPNANAAPFPANAVIMAQLQGYAAPPAPVVAAGPNPAPPIVPPALPIFGAGPPAAPPPAVVLPPRPRPGPRVPAVAFVPSPAQAAMLVGGTGPRAFGNTFIPDWRAVKILGAGGNGVVALWEYIGLPVNRPPGIARHNRVAVKTATNFQFPLDEEVDFMWKLSRSGNCEHLVQLLKYPAEIMDPARIAAEGLHPLWNGRIRRLIMEYCPQGSLEDLLQARRARNLLFAEVTLWHIFDCLIDACSIMDFRTELTLDTGGQAVIPQGYPEGNEIAIHFDVKPANILAGDRNPGHTTMPVYKIADFGVALWLLRGLGLMAPHPTYQMNQQWRNRGTWAYRAPEQFSPRWNFGDYNMSPVCGQYGSATNVWQIGQIMYELACLTQGVAEVHMPFRPAYTIDGAPALGNIFGTRLEGQPQYSKQLKDMIHQCLYEIPGFRPSLVDLKTRVAERLQFFLDLETPAEPWEDLGRPEPMPPGQPVPPAVGLAVLQCTCLRQDANMARCKKRKRVRADHPRPRCFAHKDLVRYPHGF
ncbi:uncharacterized protein L3040_007379 [Drepanopeziza brunnea f. sp. 'multigermtubi']|uniref:uncharacterized protein n=1 Tax=Drepanopeziza brunnea f. sp. 'multigermtubi' TaxID=698441 RepID=UPI0023A53955|nr:hypothetical protein L3040_007379 [Drepanopeziza brunnea f. sp. 'multigermtubi']